VGLEAAAEGGCREGDRGAGLLEGDGGEDVAAFLAVANTFFKLGAE